MVLGSGGNILLLCKVPYLYSGVFMPHREEEEEEEEDPFWSGGKRRWEAGSPTVGSGEQTTVVHLHAVQDVAVFEGLKGFE